MDFYLLSRGLLDPAKITAVKKVIFRKIELKIMKNVKKSEISSSKN